MNKLHISLFTSLILAVIISSCQTTDPFIADAQSNLAQENFDAVVLLADDEIAKDSLNPNAYYYKAAALNEIALQQDVFERKPYYKRFRKTIVRARELYDSLEINSNEAKNVTNVILNAWGVEHNEAVKYATNDSVMSSVDNPFEISAAHLENAIIVNPDSVLSYDVLSQVYAMNQKMDSAVSAVKQAMALQDEPADFRFYDRLGNYYLLSKEFDNAVSSLEKGLEFYPDSISLVQKLADAYMSVGELEKGFEVVEDLIKRDPENPQYYLVLGTQIYRTTSDLSDSVSASYDKIYELSQEARNASSSKRNEIESQIEDLRTEIQKLQSQINSLAQRAETQLNKVIELRPNDETAYQTLGIIYQNKAAALFEERNYTADNEKAAELDEEAKAQLRKAMEYHEKVVDINPDNRNSWQALTRIYATLDLQEKYQEAVEKSGM